LARDGRNKNPRLQRSATMSLRLLALDSMLLAPFCHVERSETSLLFISTARDE